MKAKIVNVRAQPPAYDLYWKEPRPEINWETSDGRWVGIWGYGWGDLVGTQVLKQTSEFGYEVWQPDLRAEKVYAYKYDSGLIHKLYPAVLRKKKYGTKSIEFVSSPAICSELASMYGKSQTIIHLNGINIGIARELLSLDLPYPILVEFLGDVKSPLDIFIQFKKNVLSKINDVDDYFIVKRLFKHVDIICCCNEKSRVNLRRYFDKEIYIVPVGLDCIFWRSSKNKSKVRKNLGLTDKPTMLSSSRLNSLKQLDRVIFILKKLDKSFDFQYIITGHGTEEYENYLRNIGDDLIKNGKLKFVGYLQEAELREYYEAADLFIITSLSEGAPDAAKKALAMEVPVFSTNTGYIAELLAEHHVGKVVPLRDYSIWEEELRYFLEGGEILTMDSEKVSAYFHWPNVAKQYLDIYEQLYSNYCAQ